MSNFKDKVVLVTGASSGIGHASALEFLARGATVFGIASSETSAGAARAKAPAIKWMSADLRAPGAADTVVREVLGVPAASTR